MDEPVYWRMTLLDPLRLSRFPNEVSSGALLVIKKESQLDRTEL